MPICGVTHPNLPKISCGRIAAEPKSHNGPCAAICFILWGGGTNLIIPESEFTHADFDHEAERCASTQDARMQIRCQWPAAHKNDHWKRVTLEWEFNKHGRIRRSAVVDGRVEDLELKYGGPVEAVLLDDDLTPISNIGPDKMEDDLEDAKK